MPALLRLLSILWATEKPFLSRTGHYHSLLRRKLSMVGIRAILRIKLRPIIRAKRKLRRWRQQGWSLQSTWSMTTYSSFHIRSRRMTQVSRLFYALSLDVTSITLSVTRD
jgi:hypothetical protein